MVVSPSALKPLMLIYLLHDMQVKSALCFTDSTDSANRLQRLIAAYEARHQCEHPIVVAEYSSELSSHDRRTLLQKFSRGEIHL